MSSKPSKSPAQASGQKLFYLCLGLAATAGLSIFLWPYLLWGFITLSLDMGWATWGDAKTATPWDGCVPPMTAAERDDWVANSQATGQPLCDPSIVEMEFPEAEGVSESTGQTQGRSLSE